MPKPGNIWIITKHGKPMRFYSGKSGNGLGYSSQAHGFLSYKAAHRTVVAEQKSAYLQRDEARAEGRIEAVDYWTDEANAYRIIRINFSLGFVGDAAVTRMLFNRKLGDSELRASAKEKL